jgi:hypothetical protein
LREPTGANIASTARLIVLFVSNGWGPDSALEPVTRNAPYVEKLIAHEERLKMWIHNPTCGCADCGNYGQPYNPHAIHNQSCGCPKCGNYPPSNKVEPVTSEPNLEVEKVVLTPELLDLLDRICSALAPNLSKTKK